MSFLEFPDEKEKKKKKINLKLEKGTGTGKNDHKIKTKPTAETSLNRVPPKIEPIKSSELLSRAAAFLPQLAASNRAILQKRPEDVNIEMLSGREEQVIEMKLGLGVLEERQEGSDESSDTETDETGKILVLPSELRAAAKEATERNRSDPFEKIINSLLLFATDDEENEDEYSGSEMNNKMLDFD